MDDDKHAGNVVLLRSAAIWLLMGLLLAWVLVGMVAGAPFLVSLFQSFPRVLSAHLDYLLMSAIIFGLYAVKVRFPWHVNWSIALGAFTNPSLFLFMAIFPELLDAKAVGYSPDGIFPIVYGIYSTISILMTTYGFGMAAHIILRSTRSKKK